MDILPGASNPSGNLQAVGIWLAGWWVVFWMGHLYSWDTAHVLILPSTLVSLQEIHRRFRRGGRSHRGEMKLRRSGVDGGRRQGQGSRAQGALGYLSSTTTCELKLCEGKLCWVILQRCMCCLFIIHLPCMQVSQQARIWEDKDRCALKESGCQEIKSWWNPASWMP